MDDAELLPAKPLQGEKSQRLDQKFFGPGQGGAGHMTMPFNHQYSEQGKRQLTGRKLQTMTALEKGIDPAEVKHLTSKKHGNAGKRKHKASRAERA